MIKENRTRKTSKRKSENMREKQTSSQRHASKLNLTIEEAAERWRATDRGKKPDTDDEKGYCHPAAERVSSSRPRQRSCRSSTWDTLGTVALI